jgi:Flp pilus assembly protein TadD
MELHEWNPMRAMKDVEVGDYYYRRENYKAALSRYREALQFKPHDAVATFKLAQTLEKTKEFEQARAQYEEYLAILKDGPNAPEAKKALARLKRQ